MKVTIETKYNVGDDVYRLTETGQIQCKTIRSVHLSLKQKDNRFRLEDGQLVEEILETKEVTYGFDNGYGGETFMSETGMDGRFFASPEALLDSIAAQAKRFKKS